MFSTIRRRVMICQAAILLAVILGFGVTLYLQVQHLTMDQVDSDLLGTAQSLAAQLKADDGAKELTIPEAFRYRFGRVQRDAPYFAVWNADGKLLFQSEDAPDRIHPEPLAAFERSPRRFLIRGRLPSHEVIVRGPDDSQILVGRELHREFGYFSQLAWRLVIAGLCVLAIGLTGAWLLSQMIVVPIEKMTDTAERISATNLAQRIEVPTSKSELSRLAVVMNRMLERLQASFERQTRFTADASHELRTPISVVLSHSELALARDRSPEEYKEALGACHRAAQRLRGLVEGLLTLARSDVGQLESRREAVDLQPVVENAVLLLAPLADQKQLLIKTDLQPVSVNGDADRLGQVVANLISNAIAYSHEQGEIRVTLSPQGDVAVLQVVDAGIGISESDLPHIFERFFRVDKARTANRGGVGIGLSICQEIVKAYGGQIIAESTLGEGTTLTVTLPRSGLKPSSN